jgi:hypothetical protein
MRGHTHCRTHRRSVAEILSLPKGDRELGPRGGGAPPRNLNALSHAGYSNGLPEPDLVRLAAAAIDSGDPESFEGLFGSAILTLWDRRSAAEILSLPKGTGDPFRALLALECVLDWLIDRVATDLFHQELTEVLAPIPPQEREGIQSNIERLAARDGHRKALVGLRRRRRDLEKKEKSNGNKYRNRG